MKKCRKLLSVLLCAVLCAGCLVFPSAAEDAFPQSEHPYANDLDETYTYTYPGDVDGFYMTFSEDTFFETDTLVFFDKNGVQLDLTVDEVLEMDTAEFLRLVDSYEYKQGDLLCVYAGDEYLRYYDGDSLAGTTVYIPGNTVKLELISDESVSCYGFSVDRISAEKPEDVYTVTYDLDGRTDMVYCYKDGEEAEILSGSGIMNGDKVCKAWSTTKGGAAVYDGGETFTVTADTALYPVYTSILLSADEVYNFDNDYEPFAVNKYDVNEEDGSYSTDYYMSEDDYNTMLNNLLRFGALSAAGSMAGYPESYWGGSCYGMSLTVALHHLGMLDLFIYGNGENSVKDLAPTPQLISCINYYQAQEYPASKVENTADYPGTFQYSYQLKKMYETVKNGNIVLFGFYENHSYDSLGHAVLLTGAYDDFEGNHVLIAYDCNYGSSYSNGTATRYIIAPDYTYMTSEIYGDIIGFDWLSDFSCFESFDINGEGDASSWFKSIFRHIRDFFDMIKSFFASLFGL